ncbi:MAG: hypothetical protein WKF79_15835 [Nocardioides sp.]
MTSSSELEEGYRRLEAELTLQRRFGAQATRDLHEAMLADVRAARSRARRAVTRAENAESALQEAKARARKAERRASRAEDELATLRASSTWKAGRAVVAVPSFLRRRGRS